MKNIKLKWQEHNRDNGLSWNEVAELVDEVRDAVLGQLGEVYKEVDALPTEYVEGSFTVKRGDGYEIRLIKL